jgi:hypothetical protein
VQRLPIKTTAGIHDTLGICFISGFTLQNWLQAGVALAEVFFYISYPLIFLCCVRFCHFGPSRNQAQFAPGLANVSKDGSPQGGKIYMGRISFVFTAIEERGSDYPLYL